MKVSILGFGTIGSGVNEIIGNKKNTYLNDIEVVKILDLPQNRHKSDKIVCSINEIVEDKEITLVVETLGGLHPAYEYIMQALKHGKHVVTANKAVVAKYLKQFVETANQYNVSFLFEASTGGGIPWIAAIQKTKRIDTIDSFYGIFNGTTNFILDHMYKHGSAFNDVLSIAQNLGYAEFDPSADIDGYDIANKVSITSSIAFDHYVEVESIPCIGIRNIRKEDVAYFKQRGKCVKFIGEATLLGNEFETGVFPTVFSKDSMEANIVTNFNICTLHGETIGDLKFYGQGAGKLPTANAIIQDILDIKTNSQGYNIKMDTSLIYNDELFSNKYIVRSEKGVKSILVESNEDMYYYTHLLTTKQAMALYKEVLALDPSAIMFKHANQ